MIGGELCGAGGYQQSKSKLLVSGSCGAYVMSSDSNMDPHASCNLLKHKDQKSVCALVLAIVNEAQTA